MARKNKDLSNVFDSLQPKQEDKIDEDIKNENHNNSIEKNLDSISEDSLSNPSQLDEDDVVEDFIPDDSYQEYDDETSSNDFSDFKKDILVKYNEKRKKKTMEETHIRTTFLLERSLAKRLDKLTKNKRGLKTLVLNDAVEAIVKAMEENN